MRTIAVNLYKYPELSEKAKEQAREQFCTRGWGTDDFRDSVGFMIDNLKEEAPKQGINVRDVAWEDRSWGYFDVALEATIDVAAFMKAHKLAGKFRALYNVATEQNPNVGIYNAYRSIRHGAGCSFDGEPTAIEFSGSGPFTVLMVQQSKLVEEAIDAEIERIERQLASDMAEELEYCHSEEVIADALTINEYEFTANGEMA